MTNEKLLIGSADVAFVQFERRRGGGLYQKKEMLSPRAYGFRNFENYCLYVLAQCGWNGEMDRVW